MSGARLGHLPFVTALGLVALPNLVFLGTHLASPIVAIACAACVAAGAAWTIGALLRHPVPLDIPLLLAALGAGFALNCLGGQAHLFYANDDWLIRDAVLRDLVVAPWPVGYRYLGDATILRAPLGLYLTPALVGKVGGLRAAHAALLAQDTVLFGCLLYAFAQPFAPRRVALGVLMVVVAFGGWDIVGAWWLDRPLAFGSPLEGWMPGQQFTSHVTQVFWVPNHAASGWTFVAAYLLWHRRHLDAGGLTCVFGLCAFWSPLSMIGALPFLARAVAADGLGGRLRTRQRPAAILTTFLPAILTTLGLAPVLLYLLADSGRVPHGFRTIDPDFLAGAAIFLVLEIGPALLVILAAGRPGPERRPMARQGDMPLILAILLFVPLYRLGDADFVMRASIPALALLALRFGEAAATASTARLRLAAIAVAAVGAGAPAYEIGRAVLRPAFAIGDCSLLAASQVPPNDGPLFHYLARTERIDASLAGRVLAPPARIMEAAPRPPCWPDRVTVG